MNPTATILVVDDEPDVREVLEEYFTAHGYAVLGAENAAAARALAENPGRVLSRERILNLTQRRDWDPFDRSVDLRILRLRKKIEPDPDHPRHIRTVRNEGYVFIPDGA